MGECADMILDGILCQGCGDVIDGKETGYPRSCYTCQINNVTEDEKEELKKCKDIRYVPITPDGTPLESLASITKQEAIRQIIIHTAGVFYHNWPYYRKQGWTIEEWPVEKGFFPVEEDM